MCGRDCTGKIKGTQAYVVLYWLRNIVTAQWPERGGSAVSAHSNPGSLQSMDASAMTATLSTDLCTQI